MVAVWRLLPLTETPVWPGPAWNSLCINHSASSQCSHTQFVSDCGIPPHLLDHRCWVCRGTPPRRQPLGSQNQAGRGDHGCLDFQNPDPYAGARSPGGPGPESTAPGAAPAGTEPRAPAHAAGTLPPGLPRLARVGGWPGPLAAAAGPRPQRSGPRPVDVSPPLPAPSPRRHALPAGPILRIKTARTQPPLQPLWPRGPAQVDGAAWWGWLGGGEEQETCTWGPLTDLLRDFLQLVSKEAGCGPRGEGSMARAAGQWWCGDCCV
ncbi:F-box only protein 27 isoform X7 [Rattus norvegicus]